MPFTRHAIYGDASAWHDAPLDGLSGRIEHNLGSQSLADEKGRLGSVPLKFAYGAFSVDMPATDDTSVVAQVEGELQYRVLLSFTDPGGGGRRNWDSGWFSLLAPVDVFTVDGAVSPVAAQSGVGFLAQMQAIYEQAIEPTETQVRNVVAADIANPATDIGGVAAETFGQVAAPNEWADTQAFNRTDAFATFGDELLLKFLSGHGAQRLVLTGRNEDTTPFIDIVPVTDDPDTWAHDPTVAGFQVYRLGQAGEEIREFLAIEAFGQEQNFYIRTWKSGTGQFRPLVLAAGFNSALTIVPGHTSGGTGTLILGSKCQFRYDGGTIPVPIRLQRDGDLSQEIRVHSDAGGDLPRLFLGRTKGTAAAQTPPANNTYLGDVRAGSINNDAQVPSGILRFKATEDWVFGSNQGTGLEVRLIANGTTGFTTGAYFQAPLVEGETVLTMQIKVGPAFSYKKVLVGAPDSGGAGFRALRMEN